ncbi:MAG: prepilin-type N-terminal cleavage/methylation domain-containing protein [Candidatus Marinimicrobia bacterium]|nr:prepilin-type N-terminal cleavage/methylation domain-containing protein [Candidatus Neomarinimicrobiota bacterium]
MTHSSYINNDRGFSLLELMVVIVIIGVLAAIAIPIYGNSVEKAKQAEADVALGSIRSQLRIYYAEFGSYPDGLGVSVIEADWGYFQPGELTGAYFSDDSYTYSLISGNYYMIRCAGGNILDHDRTLNQDGTFGETTRSGSSWIDNILAWLGW